MNEFYIGRSATQTQLQKRTVMSLVTLDYRIPPNCGSPSFLGPRNML